MRTSSKLALAIIITATPSALLAAAFTGISQQPPPPEVRSTVAMPAAMPIEVRQPRIDRVAQQATISKSQARLVSKDQSANTQNALLSEMADSIHVRFQGFKEINGTYRLNEDETVSIPGVGRISITGMSAKDLEVALVKHILVSTGREAPVSVEVSTYRHVFVDGIVSKPGSFQWQRGLTVIKAVSMTGGIYRPNATRLAAENPIAQRGRLDITRLKLAQALVRHARLTAELEDRKLLRLPERLIGVYGSNRANELITDEQVILDNRRALVKAQLQTLDAQQQSIQVEVDRLKSLAQGMLERTKSYAGLLNKLRQTHRQGGISNQRLFEVENRLGDLEEKLANTNVQLVRARSALQQVASKRSELTEARREKMIEEEIKARTDIGTLQIQYDVAVETISSQSGGIAISLDDDNASSGFRYEIIRRKAGREQRIGAVPLDELMPGDTLIVSRSTASATAAPASQQEQAESDAPLPHNARPGRQKPDQRSSNAASKPRQYTKIAPAQ